MKKQKLQQLCYDAANDKQGFTMYDRTILDGVETLNDFKNSIRFYADMHNTCKEQLDNGKKIQWYLGNQYRYTFENLQSLMHSICKLNEIMGYKMEVKFKRLWYISEVNGWTIY
jgi:hypothetical protein